ncbi:MAG: class I SAM-dependent methyltransferase [Anaerolineaceae bacterium]|nr:class I SAM-dependent methyltransferase [Anaerolineaceae bacterium]
MIQRKKKYGKIYYEGILGRSSNNSQRNRNRLRVILSRKREGTLLEIGCGKGKFLRMAEKHFQIEGIDISKYAVDSTKSFINGRIRREDVEHSHLQANTYNVIAAFNVLEHLRKPDLSICKIYNGLKDGGLFMGSVPYNATLVGKTHTALTNIFDPTHCSTYPPCRWHSLFETAGFRKISFCGEVMLGKNLSMYLRHRFWRVMAFNLIFLCEK